MARLYLGNKVELLDTLWNVGYKIALPFLWEFEVPDNSAIEYNN